MQEAFCFVFENLLYINQSKIQDKEFLKCWFNICLRQIQEKESLAKNGRSIVGKNFICARSKNTLYFYFSCISGSPASEKYYALIINTHCAKHISVTAYKRIACSMWNNHLTCNHAQNWVCYHDYCIVKSHKTVLQTFDVKMFILENYVARTLSKRLKAFFLKRIYIQLYAAFHKKSMYRKLGSVFFNHFLRSVGFFTSKKLLRN